MDSGTAKPVYLGYARHCDAQGAGAVCGDRAPAARRLVDGAYAVVLSETEQGSGFGEISEYSSITSDFPFALQDRRDVAADPAATDYRFDRHENLYRWSVRSEAPESGRHVTIATHPVIRWSDIVALQAKPRIGGTTEEG
jgi:hypothetical protein